MKNVIKIYCDGGSRGNPGNAASAFVVEKNGKIIFSESKFLGKTTNNIAEYSAVLLALNWIKKNKEKLDKEITFILDSELVARQLDGLYKVKNENLRNMFYSIKKISSEINLKIIFKNVAREKNKTADSLVNKELDVVRENFTSTSSDKIIIT